MTTYQRIELAVKDAVSSARVMIPIDTGNLRYNSFKIEPLGDMKWKVYIDEKVAPYAPYVNEKWISPKWKGKTNPNEGFWERVFEFIANQISAATNGQIKWS